MEIPQGGSEVSTLTRGGLNPSLCLHGNLVQDGQGEMRSTREPWLRSMKDNPVKPKREEPHDGRRHGISWEDKIAAILE